VKDRWIIFIIASLCLITLISIGIYFLIRPSEKLIGTTYDLVLLDDPSAKCLDGSQAGYYVSREGDPNKLFVYFEGGGWCGDKDSGQYSRKLLSKK
jgi:hypothetical protein